MVAMVAMGDILLLRVRVAEVVAAADIIEVAAVAAEEVLEVARRLALELLEIPAVEAWVPQAPQELRVNRLAVQQTSQPTQVDKWQS